MKKLLIDNKNISVESEATDGEVKLLTMTSPTRCSAAMFRICISSASR